MCRQPDWISWMLTDGFGWHLLGYFQLLHYSALTVNWFCSCSTCIKDERCVLIFRHGPKLTLGHLGTSSFGCVGFAVAT